jgi:hypothetical protein
MKCPKCKSRQLVEIELSIAGEQVVLKSCSACDVRWWEGDGASLPLSSLLDLAATTRRRRAEAGQYDRSYEPARCA